MKEEIKDTSVFKGYYPPLNQMLSDLSPVLVFHAPGRATLRAPVCRAVSTDGGAMLVGAIAALMDVLGGGLALTTFYPDWAATSHLSVQSSGRALSGYIDAHGELRKTGRNTVLVKVDIRHTPHEQGGFTPVATAIIGFTRFSPRKDSPSPRIDPMAGKMEYFNPDRSGLVQPHCQGDTRKRVPGGPLPRQKLLDEPSGGHEGPLRSTHGGPESIEDPGCEPVGIHDKVGLKIVNEAEALVQVEMSDYVRNSFNVLHGGVVALLTDLAGQTAARHVTGKPFVTTDLAIHFLRMGEVGPFQTRTTLLRKTDEAVLSLVEILDTGAGGRLLSIATNLATPEDLEMSDKRGRNLSYPV
jgi:uncharacterized protein (TIGR00369 family)